MYIVSHSKKTTIWLQSQILGVNISGVITVEVGAEEGFHATKPNGGGWTALMAKREVHQRRMATQSGKGSNLRKSPALNYLPV